MGTDDRVRLIRRIAGPAAVALTVVGVCAMAGQPRPGGLPGPRNPMPRMRPSTAPAPSQSPADDKPTTTPAAPQAPTPPERAPATVAPASQRTLVEDLVRRPAPSGLGSQPSPTPALREALQRSLDEHGLDDLTVGARIRIPAAAESQTVPGATAARDLLKDRGVNDAAAQQMLMAADPAVALQAARDQYLPQGYREVELAPGDHAFIKGDDNAISGLQGAQARCVMSRAEAISRAPLEQMRLYEDEGRDRAEVGSAPTTDRAGDTFLKTGSTTPPPETQTRDHDPIVAGNRALREGHAAEAADLYAGVLAAEPENTFIMRLRGIALLLDSKIAPGLELIARAYTTDPSLASIPVTLEQLPASGDVVARAIDRAVQAGRRSNTAAAWLAAAVLMQARGREEQAARFVARASESGLDQEIVREWRASAVPQQGKSP